MVNSSTTLSILYFLPSWVRSSTKSYDQIDRLGRSRMHDRRCEAQPVPWTWVETFNPARSQIRSTRLSLDSQPASHSSAAMTIKPGKVNAGQGQ